MVASGAIQTAHRNTNETFSSECVCALSNERSVTDPSACYNRPVLLATLAKSPST